MAKLDSHFKCPKWLKVATMYQTKEMRRSMFEAYQSYLDYKRRSLKRDKVDRTDKSNKSEKSNAA